MWNRKKIKQADSAGLAQQSQSSPKSAATPPFPRPAKPNPTKGSYVVALLEFCSPLVRKCHGCSGFFKIDGEMPHSPLDMVIVTNEDRQYFDKTKNCMQTKPSSNTYYHLHEKCVKTNNSYFLPTFLFVPNDLKPHLNADHVQLLKHLNVHYH